MGSLRQRRVWVQRWLLLRVLLLESSETEKRVEGYLLGSLATLCWLLHGFPAMKVYTVSGGSGRGWRMVGSFDTDLIAAGPPEIFSGSRAPAGNSGLLPSEGSWLRIATSMTAFSSLGTQFQERREVLA